MDNHAMTIVWIILALLILATIAVIIIGFDKFLP